MSGRVGDVNLPAQQFQYTCFVDSGGRIYADRHTALVVFRRVNGICHRGLASPHADIVHRIRFGKRIVVVRRARQKPLAPANAFAATRRSGGPAEERARRAMSPLGTLETCRRTLRMSADRGTALSQNDATDPLGHQRPPKFSSRDVFKVSRLGRYNCRILIVGVGMQRREFSLGRPAANSAGWNHSA